MIYRNLAQTIVACFFLTTLCSQTAFATIEIMAKVNGKPITNYEVSQRIKFLATVTSMKINDDNRSRIQKDALQMLIDEKLKLSAAEKLDPNITNRSLAKARELVNVSFQRNGKSGSEILKELKLDTSLIQRKFTTDIAWASFIQTQFSNKLGNIEAKIDAELDRRKKNASQPQIRLSELVLAPEPNRPMRQTIMLANEIVAAVAKGANFNAISQQYSVSGSAQNGGRLGWLFINQLPTDIAEALSKTEIGAVTQPVLQDGAVLIFQKDGERKNGQADPSQDRVWLSRAVLPLPNKPSNADRLEAAARLQRESNNVSTCADLLKLNLLYGTKLQGSLDNILIAGLAPQMRKLVNKLEIGKISVPLSFQDSVAVFMLCKREKAKINLPSREEVKSKIVDKFFGSLGERYLLRLRRAAVIERQ